MTLQQRPDFERPGARSQDPEAHSPRGIFVTATDTGVGKTLLTCALVRMLREQCIDAVGFKPVASGQVNGIWGDAYAIHDASGRCEPLEILCPLRFKLPLAPTLAAWSESVEPDINISHRVLSDLRKRHAYVVVEGVGGLLVPLDRQTLVLDFAKQLGFPVLLVCRAALGTINHTLLTLRELERASLPVAGIIMNVTRAADAAMVDGSKSEIERVSGRKIIAVLPYLESGDPADAPQSALIARAMVSLSQQVDVRALAGIDGGSRSRPA
jgi:dethiobiotin synthetase